MIHKWTFVSSHANNSGTVDEYYYCDRCGTMKHDAVVDDEIKQRLFTTMFGDINTTREPPCADGKG